ncbi:hypothetical protein [Sphingomonas sp. GC_Shp_3]|uniref:hypothetical protein n=1 Tax=Sphingomonas sp. GC_Shp_3 TaxID=2937383 RepID=UPI0022697F24|nr:hypothetical protein [Sphingomonas sp. GC_Shp_3]
MADTTSKILFATNALNARNTRRAKRAETRRRAGDDGKRLDAAPFRRSRDETLASGDGTWQGCAMTPEPSNNPAAGGVLIAIGAVGGALVGLFLGEPTKGFLLGIGAGIGMAIAIWVIDRRR